MKFAFVLASALLFLKSLIAPGAETLSGTRAPAFVPPAGCAKGSPAYNFPGSGDAPDPDIVYYDGLFYAFTTGTALGNHIQVLVSNRPTSNFKPVSGNCYGSSALPKVPSWQQANTETSPGVFSIDGHLVMFYDAATAGHKSDSGYDCLSVATAKTIGLHSAVFVDTSKKPLLCQRMGSIDPSPLIDRVNGHPYLVWKQNDGGSTAPAYLWSRELTPAGTAFAPHSHAYDLLFNNTALYPWEGTAEDPSMADTSGKWYLLFSAGVYTSSSYLEAITTCAGPVGPCHGPQRRILTSYGSILGPGGGSMFKDAKNHLWLAYQGWVGGSAGCTNYTCGASRKLYVTEMKAPLPT